MPVGIILSILCVLVSFVLVVFGFLNIFPLFIATPILFLSILFILVRVNSRNRFKGFKL